MSLKVKIVNDFDNENNITQMPVIALRGLVLFPGSVIQFEVGREKSVAAAEFAMENSSTIFLVTQKNIDTENPLMKDIYNIGVVAEVKQVLRISDHIVKVLVEAKYRAKMVELDSSGDFLVANTSAFPVVVPDASSAELEALVRTVKESFEKYILLNPRLPKDVIFTILASNDARLLSDYIPANLFFKFEEKQEILSETAVDKRLEKIISLLTRENNIISLEKEIQSKVHEQMDKNQRDYYLREQMRAISNELDEDDNTVSEAENYKEKILALHLEEDTTQKLLKEADRLAKMPGATQEAAVIRGYLDTCIELPWHVFTEDTIDIQSASDILDAGHYGLTKVKQRILEILAVKKLAPNVKSQIICLVGPPGVGKTSIAHSIAECLGRKFTRMSLGGVRDEAEIRGHRRTYVGAMPGKIISAIQTAKSANPLILLDEIDKLANDFRGDPAAALLEVLDPEQNSTFKDHFLDIPFDLSNVLFITTANSWDTIPRPLLDRMDIIELSSYTREEKFQIAKRHLVPKQLENTGLKGKVRLTDSAIYGLIDYYTKEAGVRNLERSINEVLRKCAVEIAENADTKKTVTAASLEKMIGPHRNKQQFSMKKDTVGVANGLAWTSVGGELLPIEVQVIENGSGRIELTGSLGDVMKESAKLAVTYARVHAQEYGIDSEIFKKCDIHIHAPEGAVPKDGPSAGVTLTTALISTLSGIPVRSDVAMTGEITLHGDVLPIGGLKEKSMAAYREKIKTVLIPQDNVSDLYDVDDTVKESITFMPMKNLKQVLDAALLKTPKEAKKRSTPLPHSSKNDNINTIDSTL